MSNLVYLIVYNAHNGEVINIPKPIRFHTLNEFKHYISHQFNIDDINHIFLLTTFGIKLNFNLINDLTDVYVFDKRLFGKNGQEYIVNYFKQDIIMKPAINDMPETIEQNQMIGYLKNNQRWTRSILETSNHLQQKITTIINHINIIFTSLNIIFQFGANFINEIEKNFVNYFNHIKLINLKTLHKSWSTHYQNLKKFPIFEIQDSKINFIDLLSIDKLQNSASYIGENLPLIIEKFNQMNQTIDVVNQEKFSIDKVIENLRHESINLFKNTDLNDLITSLNQQARFLINDIDKISSSSSSSVPVNITQIYQIHKNQYSFKIYEIINQLYDYYETLNKFEHHLILNSIEIFQNIANLQMKMVNIKDDLKNLTQTSEKVDGLSYKTISQINRDEDYLSLTIDLPLLFGFLIIERRRQFEWYDFYSKGVVANVTEQLTTIIDNEKLFRTIWNKKFGNFLNLVSESSIQIQLPNLDVTLIGGRQESFNILQNITIERKDITDYIAILDKSNVSKNFVELLNKNYKDLISSTNNMKKITKVISSLSAYTSISKEDKSKIIQRGEDSQDIDLDMKLINGLKSRIKKLENLLHQQQYKNLFNWPVTTTTNGDNKASMIMDRKRTSPPLTSNPKNLLQRSASVNDKPSYPSQNALDTTGLDKHLDNIRLKKEIAEIMSQNTLLVEENNRLKTRNQDLVEENVTLADKVETLSKENSSLSKSTGFHKDKIEELQEQTKFLEDQLSSNKKDYEEKLERKEELYRLLKLDVKIDAKEIENLNKKIEQKNEKLDELQEKLIELRSLNNYSESGYDKMRLRIESLEEELAECKRSKNDLLSNMSSKESEFTKERNSLETEIKDLHFKLENLQMKSDEISEDYENLMELTHSKEKNNDLLTNDLNNIIITLLNSIRRLVEHDFDTFLEFCLILESMGLLLVQENKEYKITRVKGLRSKKDEDASEAFLIEKPSSEVIKEIEAKKSWVSEISSYTSILPSDSVESPNNFESSQDDSVYKQQSMKLISLFNTIFNSENSKFESFFKAVGFKENIHLQEDSPTTRFFLNAVSKRFRDVEGFAKRQTKENKSKQQEIGKLLARLDTKISMNGFQINDLVLFLPTRIDRNNDEFQEDSQPWAAFNIGAPHYFLLVEDHAKITNKDWMVGRVKSIKENKVTEDNVDKIDLNPFQLSVGVMWYMISADEEHF